MITDNGKYYLYRHIRLDKNEPFYIGIGTKNKKDLEFNDYFRATSRKSRNKIWKSILAKTDYAVEILLESDNYDFIKQKEIEFIALYGRKNLNNGSLVNLTDGGDGALGVILSMEARQKISIKSSNKSEEHLDKIRHSIFQYDAVTGKFIQELKGKTNSAKDFKLDRTSICMAIKSKNKYSKGYLWFDKYQGENVKPFNGVFRQFNGIIMLDKITKEEICYFETITKAFNFLNKKHSGHLIRAARNEDTIAYGYKWKLKL